MIRLWKTGHGKFMSFYSSILLSSTFHFYHLLFLLRLSKLSSCYSYFLKMGDSSIMFSRWLFLYRKYIYKYANIIKIFNVKLILAYIETDRWRERKSHFLVSNVEEFQLGHLERRDGSEDEQILWCGLLNKFIYHIAES